MAGGSHSGRMFDFGTCYLAIQYWNIYSVVNEHEKTIMDAWDEANLKFTFRRTVSKLEILMEW
jgi:hypothetical protein